MKYSKQRDVVLKTVKNSFDHPTADTIYNRVKMEIPNISLGTVYRNLNQLVDNNLIRKIVMPQSGDRFDKTLETHYHFLCINCNEVTDIKIEKQVNLNKKIEKDFGHNVYYHDIVFIGKCNDCLKKEG